MKDKDSQPLNTIEEALLAIVKGVYKTNKTQEDIISRINNVVIYLNELSEYNRRNSKRSIPPAWLPKNKTDWTVVIVILFMVSVIVVAIALASCGVL